MNEIQIYIVGKGYLDLLEQTNFPLVINKSIANISDISARDSTFSYDFEIPNNTNNNKILFGAEFVNATDKAILGKQDAVILLNGAEYERGFVEVKISKYLDKYVCNFFGGNAEWVELGNDLLVKDLGFSPDLTTYDLATITAQNTGDASNSDYHFPAIDRNTIPVVRVGITSIIQKPRPVFYVKAIFEKFFGHNSIGYTIESNFLSSKFVLGEADSNNKGLAVDLGCVYEFEDSIITETVAEISANRSGILDPYFLGRLNLNYPTVSARRRTLPLKDFYNVELSDDYNLWQLGTGYTVPKKGNYIINYNFRNSKWRSYFQTSPSSGFLLTSLSTDVPSVSGAYPFTLYIPLIRLSWQVNGVKKGEVNINNANRLNGLSGSFTVFLNEDDILTFGLTDTGLSTVTGIPLLSGNTNLYQLQPANNPLTIQLKSKIEEGDQYQISSVIPKDIKAIELITDFKLLFNLYFEADIKRKVVKIEPRNDWKDADFDDVTGYYKSVGLATNWTELIDLNFAPEIHTELPYNRTLIYRYKKDSDDKWLEQWERNNNRTYAEYRTDLNKPDPLLPELKRFPNGETVYETTLLAPTIQGESSGTITSIIRSEFSDLNGIDAEQPTPNNKYAPRIGWVVNGVFIMEAFSTLTPFESTATKLTFNGTSGLIDKFWSKTLSNLVNAVTLKVNVNLDKLALKNFDFSKPIYIDAPQQIKGYYVVMNIEANLMNDSMASAELLYYKDYAPITIDATQETNINPNKQNQQITPPNFVLYETETGQLINVLDEDDNGNLLTLLYE